MFVIDPGQMRAMAILSKPLQLLLRKYKNYLGETILEIGPFFHPLITPAKYHGKKIYYLDKEKHILDQFSKRGVPSDHLILHDLNKLGRIDYISLKNKIRKALSSSNSGAEKFDSIIISQVFNYIDYKKFLMRIRSFMTKGGLMFLNNVTDIGITSFYSAKRPRSAKATIETFKEIGYEIVEKKISNPVPSGYKGKGMRARQLILVARKR